MDKFNELDDDLYANDSESMGIYDDTSVAPEDDPIQQEHGLMASSYPVMDEIIQWFEDWYDEVCSINSLSVESKVPMEAQVIAMQLITDKVGSKRNEFVHKFSAYKEAMNGANDD